MRKIILLVITFILYTILIKTYPVVTEWDKSVILLLQSLFNSISVTVPLLADCALYRVMIFVPIVLTYVWGYRTRNFAPAIAITVLPLIAYTCKFVVKPLVHRPRPPMDLQLAVHPHSFSYVSTHSLVTFCIWGLVIYFLYKYCSKNYLKYAGITFGVLWILFVGLSRVWIGVHYPTDVIGGYFLGFILLTIYSKIRV